MIERLILLCLAAAMLSPDEPRIARVTLFDIVAYGTIGILALRGIIRLTQRGIASPRLTVIHAGIVGFMIVSMLAYLLKDGAFARQERFLVALGTYSPTLFLRMSLYGIATLVLLLAALELGRTSAESPAFIRRCVMMLIAAGTVNAIVSLVAWAHATGGTFGRYNFVPPIELSQGVHMDRMIITFILAFALFVRGRAAVRGSGPLLLIAMTATLASVATVFVRQGWLLLIVTTGACMLLSWRSISVRLKARAVAFAIVLSVVAVHLVATRYGPELQEYFASVFDAQSDDVAGRRTLLTQAYEIFEEHPLIGVGYGHYAAYSETPIAVSSAYIFVASAHNGMFMVLAETGIAGAICFALIVVGAMVASVRARRNAMQSGTRAVVTAIVSLLVSFILIHLVANSSIIPLPTERVMTQNAFLLWFLLGIVAGISQWPRTVAVQRPRSQPISRAA